MNLKQLIVILSIIFGSLLVLFVALILIYKFAPSFLGLQPEEQDATEIVKPEEFKSDPKVVLSRNEYLDWLQRSFNVQATIAENNFLSNYVKTLNDSISKLNTKLTELEKMNITLGDSITQIHSNFKDSLNALIKLRNELIQKYAEITLLKKQLEEETTGVSQKSDSVRRETLKNFAKIFENSDPREVAKIIENLSNQEASWIIKFMSKKKAGKVIDALKPERSAEILQTSLEK